MNQITIREVDQIENGFTAELVLEGRGNYPITITNPSPEFHSLHWEALQDPKFSRSKNHFQMGDRQTCQDDL